LPRLLAIKYYATPRLAAISFQIKKQMHTASLMGEAARTERERLAGAVVKEQYL
jgi:hypothetical protein